MKEHKIVGIVGYGYVGKAYTRFFQDHFQVWVVDPFAPGLEESSKGKVKMVNIRSLEAADLIVICVPTPMKEDGTCDTTIVEDVLNNLPYQEVIVPHKEAPVRRWNKPYNIVLKSTVSPGTTERLSQKFGGSICFSPEYVGESSYFTPPWKYPSPTDAKQHDFMVIGGNEPGRSYAVDMFSKVLGPHARIFKMGSLEAEIIKYMENSWGATKVTFSNEFYEICKAFGADWQTVREGFLADSRTERMHTMVRADARGFGGKCFPKDVAAIVEAVKKVGYDAKFLAQVIESNTKFVARNYEPREEDISIGKA